MRSAPLLTRCVKATAAATLGAAQAGWAAVAGDPTILRCHAGYWDGRFYGDAGASLAVLKAGYNLDTLQLRYQGVDWRKEENWQCNAR